MMSEMGQTQTSKHPSAESALRKKPPLKLVSDG